ncbi:MAG TPA: hypothetical protein VF996_01390 [Candidatus Saccharimonadales bacterium]|jgi:hypothetical protein
MESTIPEFDWQDSFQKVADSGQIESLEARIIDDSRRRFESGEILQGLRYSQLKDSPEDAFQETVERESEAINEAKKKLGERRSIYG